MAGPITVVGSQFLKSIQFDVIMTTKLMTLRDGSFTVTDVDKNVIFRLKGSYITLHDTHRLFDDAKLPIVTLRREILSLHNRWKVYRGDSSDAKDLLFTVERSTLLQLGIRLDVFLAENTSQVPDFKIEDSTIYLGDSNIVIAEINNELTLSSIVLGKEKFAITVNPNVDYAFVVTLSFIISAQPEAVDILYTIGKLSGECLIESIC